MSDSTVLCVSVLAGEDQLSGPDWIKVENSKTLIDVLVHVSGTRALGQHVQVVVSKEPSFTEAALVQVMNPVSLLDESRSIHVKFLLRSSVLSFKQSTDLKCKAERENDVPLIQYLQREKSMEKIIKGAETASSKINMPFESHYLNQIYMEQKMSQSNREFSKQNSVDESHTFTTWQQQCEKKSGSEHVSDKESVISLSLDGLTSWTHSDLLKPAEEDIVNENEHGLVDREGDISPIGKETFEIKDIGVNTKCQSKDGKLPELISVKEEVEITSKDEAATKKDSKKGKSFEGVKAKPCSLKNVASVLKTKALQQVKKPVKKPVPVGKLSSTEKKEPKLGMPSLRTQPTRRLSNKPVNTPNPTTTTPKPKELDDSKKIGDKPMSFSSTRLTSRLKKSMNSRNPADNESPVSATSSRNISKSPVTSFAVTPSVKRTVSPGLSMSKLNKSGGSVKEACKKVGIKGHTAKVCSGRPIVGCKLKKNQKSSESDKNNANASKASPIKEKIDNNVHNKALDSPKVYKEDGNDSKLESNGSSLKPDISAESIDLERECEAVLEDSIEIAGDSKEPKSDIEIRQGIENVPGSGPQHEIEDAVENSTNSVAEVNLSGDYIADRRVSEGELNYLQILRSFARTGDDGNSQNQQLLINAVLRSGSSAIELNGLKDCIGIAHNEKIDNKCSLNKMNFSSGVDFDGNNGTPGGNTPSMGMIVLNTNDYTKIGTTSKSKEDCSEMKNLKNAGSEGAVDSRKTVNNASSIKLNRRKTATDKGVAKTETSEVAGSSQLKGEFSGNICVETGSKASPVEEISSKSLVSCSKTGYSTQFAEEDCVSVLEHTTASASSGKEEASALEPNESDNSKSIQPNESCVETNGYHDIKIRNAPLSDSESNATGNTDSSIITHDASGLGVSHTDSNKCKAMHENSSSSHPVKNTSQNTSKNSLFFHSLLDDPLTRNLKEKYAAAQRSTSEMLQSPEKSNKAIKRTSSLNESCYGLNSKKSGFFDHLKERTIVNNCLLPESDTDGDVICKISAGSEDDVIKLVEYSLDSGSSDATFDNEASLLNVTVDKTFNVGEMEKMNMKDEKIEFLGEMGRDSKPNRTFTLDEEDEENAICSSERGSENSNNKDSKEPENYEASSAERKTFSGRDHGSDYEFNCNISENVVCHVRRKWSTESGMMDQLLVSSLCDLSKNLTSIAVRILQNARKGNSDDSQNFLHSGLLEDSQDNNSNQNKCADVFRNLRKLETKLLEIENNLNSPK